MTRDLKLRIVLATTFAAVLAFGVVAYAGDEPLDPAHNTALPCEALSTPGLVPRSAKNVVHLANVCGFVGTDIEFQSRTDASGAVRDYVFVGTMGGGLRIFDVTEPRYPSLAGSYTDPGWQGDVQVRGDVAVIGFDPLSGSAPAPSASVCLQQQGATGGVDIVRLSYDRQTGTFGTSLQECVPDPPGGGAHNSTLHPSGTWLAMSNPRSQGSVDVIDLRTTPAQRAFRIVQNGSLTASVCTSASLAPSRCISNGRPGAWSPHDIHFSADGRTMYVAAVGSDTVIVDVTNVLSGSAPAIGVAPNNAEPGGLANPHNVQISHQSDVTADGSILVVTDERGGGTSQTACNTDANGVIGGMHFWALRPLTGIPATAGASPATPKRFGGWFYPNPGLALDVFQPLLAGLGRTERACTIHVFRLGGNGSSSPGAAAPGFDGVSRLSDRRLVSAHYGAGVWWLDISGAASSLDGTAEDARSTWGNTLGWNVMPGAETWSAKEYKGFVYAGDMSRGFDVYRFGDCAGLQCVQSPLPSTPGRASGGGQAPGELAELSIVRGTTAGGKATFSFDVRTTAGLPGGQLSFTDHRLKKNVTATAIDSLTVAGAKATITGRATVDGTPGVSFVVEAEDLGEPGKADSFRIVLGDGYAAGGVLLKGNIQVSAG